jgi:hypothetical protein
MSHWYYKENRLPCIEVPKVKGGFRKPTKRDIEKYALVPSVTTILDVERKYGLEVWKESQLLEAAFKVDKSGLSLPDWSEKVKNVASTESELASDTGSEIHKAFEDYLSGKKWDEKYTDWVFCVQDWIGSKHISTMFSEQYIPTNLGYGGRYDLVFDDTIVDFKTQNLKDKFKFYRTWGRQLVAYGRAIGNIKHHISFVIDSKKSDKIPYEVKEWDDLDNLWNEFLACKTLFEAEK